MFADNSHKDGRVAIRNIKNTVFQEQAMRKEATRLFPQELLNKSRHSTICLKKRWNIHISFYSKCSIIARVARVLDSIERFASCHIVQELRSIQPLLQSPPPPHPPSPTPNNSRTPLVLVVHGVNGPRPSSLPNPIPPPAMAIPNPKHWPGFYCHPAN